MKEIWALEYENFKTLTLSHDTDRDTVTLTMFFPDQYEAFSGKWKSLNLRRPEAEKMAKALLDYLYATEKSNS